MHPVGSRIALLGASVYIVVHGLQGDNPRLVWANPGGVGSHFRQPGWTGEVSVGAVIATSPLITKS